MQVGLHNPAPNAAQAAAAQQVPVAIGHGPQVLPEAPLAPPDQGADKPPFAAFVKALNIDERTGLSKKYSEAALYSAAYSYDIKEMTTYKGHDGKMYYQVAIDREIAISKAPKISIKNQIVQTRIPVPDPLTDEAVTLAAKQVRLNIGATESRMERALFFHEIRKQVIQERFIECRGVSWNGNGTVGDFHAYGVSFDGSGHETRRRIEYDSISYTKHNENNWQDFSRDISAPLPCKYHERVFKKQKAAQKLLHAVIEKANTHIPSLEYQSKLGELTRLLEEEPAMSLNGLFVVIAKPLLGNVRHMQQEMKGDFENLAAEHVHAFIEKAARLDAERAKLNRVAPNERPAVEATIQALENDVKQLFQACKNALLLDLGEQTRDGMAELLHLARDPRMQNAIGKKNSEKQLKVVNKLNTPEIRAILQEFTQLQQAFLTELNRATPKFREMLEAEKNAAQAIPPDAPNT